MNVAAGIILFNPDLYRLKENIDALLKNVCQIVCIDNFSNNISAIRDLIAAYSQVFLIENDKNFGIAKALNQIFDWARNNKIDWVLTMDQDSICLPGLMKAYEGLYNDKRIALIGCHFLDNNTGLNSLVKSGKNKHTKVNTCITSGSLTNVDAIFTIGGFDEEMFIDYVDFDICATLREYHFDIIKINQIGLLHELGNSKIVSLFFFKDLVYNHSAFRKYYIARNSIYYARKHFKTIQIIPFALGVIKRFFYIILFENDRKEKFFCSLRGFKDGFFKAILCKRYL